jgi:hypothetical protein
MYDPCASNDITFPCFTSGRSCTTVASFSNFLLNLFASDRHGPFDSIIEVIVADILRCAAKGAVMGRWCTPAIPKRRQVFPNGPIYPVLYSRSIKPSIQTVDPIPPLPVDGSSSSRLSWLINKKERRTTNAPTQYNALEY